MTLDEFKEFTNAAIELAGRDIDGFTRASIVTTVLQNTRVQMPTELAMMEHARTAAENQGFEIRTGRANPIGGALVPPSRIG